MAAHKVEGGQAVLFLLSDHGARMKWLSNIDLRIWRDEYAAYAKRAPEV